MRATSVMTTQTWPRFGCAVPGSRLLVRGGDEGSSCIGPLLSPMLRDLVAGFVAQ
jgi:hypothetical protein